MLDAAAHDGYPDAEWRRHADPADVGWSAERLASAQGYSEHIGSMAVLVIHDGAVLAAWGEVDEVYLVHSIRKSLISALVGVHVGEGAIDLQRTVGELGIDDDPPLTDDEKQATLRHLLTSTSGVYHTAAAETDGMRNTRPERGSHAPGTFWWYNNWDFNALGTAFEQLSGTKIFEEFYVRFGEPLGMQHFRPEHGYYLREPELSRHPAYHFQLSASDLARLGLLFLRQGAWRGRQIIPAAWVVESTKEQVDTKRRNLGYGFLWWPWRSEPYRTLGMYSARGLRGHALDVIPAMDLVVVHRVDSLGGGRVSFTQRKELLRRILRAAPAHLWPKSVR